jgi:hypothetical protein
MQGRPVAQASTPTSTHTAFSDFSSAKQVHPSRRRPKFVTLLNSCIADDCSGKVGRRQARHVPNRKSVKEVAASGQEHVKSALLRRAAAAPFDLGIDKIRSGNCET